jgi:hypothetical protein
MSAAKFFKENVERFIGAKTDPVAYNLNKGLMNLSDELHAELQRLHNEIAHVSQQVAQLGRR